jgi:hypothetical protein
LRKNSLINRILFTAQEPVREGEDSALVAENKRLLNEVEYLRNRVREFETADRELRENLLRRVGISAAQVDNRERSPEIKPIKKTTIPWAQRAAKLEADSKERYWRKQIELRERPQEERKQSESEPQTQEQIDFDKDMADLNNVSS